MNPRDSLQNNLPKFDKNINVIKDEERLGLKKTERCNKLNATNDPGLHLGTEFFFFFWPMRALLGLLAHFEKDLQIR